MYVTVSPETLTVPCVGAIPIVTAVTSTPVIEADRLMLAAVLYGVLTFVAATVGFAGAPTVIVTVAALEVPPGLVAV